MENITIRLVSVNDALKEVNLRKLYKWKSDLFELAPQNTITTTFFNAQYDCYNFEALSVDFLNSKLQNDAFGGLTVFVTYEPLEGNQFSALLENNRIVFSLYEIQDILRDAEIPLENHIISLLYTYSLMLIASKGEDLSMEMEAKFAHDSFRKCLFDFRNDKSYVKYTSVSPILCTQCVEHLKMMGVSDKVLASVDKELKKLKKDLFYRITDFLKNHPILSLLITTLASFLLNLLCNILV